MIKTDTVAISIERTPLNKTKPPADQLGFGKYYTDHMAMIDYEPERGWHDPRIVPYQPISLDPAAKVFHYGQTVFEGMKAYRTEDGRVLIFRPHSHLERLNRSNARLSIPPIDERLALEAIRQLLLVDEAWIPDAAGTSMYIRPFIIATEPALGVTPSRTYRFMAILSPVGAYYAAGHGPVSIHVEADYVRAVAGGVGDAKTAGNYAAGLKAQEEAARGGYAQVLWLDGVHRKYVEEVGSMNVFFRIGETVVTPVLTGSFLAGITRDSVIRLLRHWGVPVEKRLVTIDEISEACRNGALREAFGTGTAAVVSPIGELCWQGDRLAVGDGLAGPLAGKLYESLTGIQRGLAPDPFGWTLPLR